MRSYTSFISVSPSYSSRPPSWPVRIGCCTADLSVTAATSPPSRMTPTAGDRSAPGSSILDAPRTDDSVLDDSPTTLVSTGSPRPFTRPLQSFECPLPTGWSLTSVEQGSTTVGVGAQQTPDEWSGASSGSWEQAEGRGGIQPADRLGCRRNWTNVRKPWGAAPGPAGTRRGRS